MGIWLQDDDDGGHTVVILQGCDEKEKGKKTTLNHQTQNRFTEAIKIPLPHVLSETIIEDM